MRSLLPLVCTALASALPLTGEASTDKVPLLDAIAADPDLSILSGALRNTSASFTRNPEFYERFNEPRDQRQYTFFAPTDAAFAKLPGDFVSAFLLPSNYEPFKSTIRGHIGEGLFTAADVTSGKPSKSIEGLPLVANGTVLDGQANIVAVDLPASNGLYHKIDAVLDRLAPYFGASAAEGKAPFIYATDRTLPLIAYIGKRADVSTWFSLVEVVAPYVKFRTAVPTPPGQHPEPIYLIPSNAAYEALPEGSLEQFKAASNNAFGQWLLRFGRLDIEGVNNDASSGYQAVLDLVRKNGGTLRVSELSSIPVNIRETTDGELFVGNARVVSETRGNNGIVWVVDKIINPLSGAAAK